MTLTETEMNALDSIVHVISQMNKVIHQGNSEKNIENDINEACVHIHALQTMIMSNAAARAYPSKFRILGGGYAS